MDGYISGKDLRYLNSGIHNTAKYVNCGNSKDDIGEINF